MVSVKDGEHPIGIRRLCAHRLQENGSVDILRVGRSKLLFVVQLLLWSVFFYLEKKKVKKTLGANLG